MQLRRLLLLHSSLLLLYLCVEFGEECVGRRLLLPEELALGLHTSLILDGLQDGLLLRHLRGLDDGELRLRPLHVEPWCRLLCLVLLQIRHLHRLW